MPYKKIIEQANRFHYFDGAQTCGVPRSTQMQSGENPEQTIAIWFGRGEDGILVTICHKPSTLKYTSCNESEQNLASLARKCSWSVFRREMKPRTTQEVMAYAMCGTVGVVTDGVYTNCICVNLGDLTSWIGNPNAIYKHK